MSIGATGDVSVNKDVYSAYSSKTEKNGTDYTTKETTKAKENASEGVVYEKTTSNEKNASYSINKMTAEERASLVEKLKEDQQNRQNQLIDIVKQMMTKQATAFGVADFGNTDNEDIWKFLAKGDYTVDEQAKLQAQQEISEDGYWGVKQTSQRLFDFASALAGDDVDSMKKMQSAMEKGFEQATKAWGKELPSISKETLDAANQLFEQYYASKTEETEA